MAMRKFQCHHYRDCLDRAARAGTMFDCSGCKRYHQVAYHVTRADLAGAIRLWLAIFHPETGLSSLPPETILKNWIDVRRQ